METLNAPSLHPPGLQQHTDSSRDQSHAHGTTGLAPSPWLHANKVRVPYLMGDTPSKPWDAFSSMDDMLVAMLSDPTGSEASTDSSCELFSPYSAPAPVSPDTLSSPSECLSEIPDDWWQDIDCDSPAATSPASHKRSYRAIDGCSVIGTPRHSPFSGVRTTVSVPVPVPVTQTALGPGSFRLTRSPSVGHTPCSPVHYTLRSVSYSAPIPGPPHHTMATSAPAGYVYAAPTPVTVTGVPVTPMKTFVQPQQEISYYWPGQALYPTPSQSSLYEQHSFAAAAAADVPVLSASVVRGDAAVGAAGVLRGSPAGVYAAPVREGPPPAAAAVAAAPAASSIAAAAAAAILASQMAAQAAGAQEAVMPGSMRQTQRAASAAQAARGSSGKNTTAAKRTKSAVVRTQTTGSTRRRWGAAQLHPQQAEIDALVASCTKDGSAARRMTAPGTLTGQSDGSGEDPNKPKCPVPRRLSGGILTAAIRQNFYARQAAAAAAAAEPASEDAGDAEHACKRRRHTVLNGTTDDMPPCGMDGVAEAPASVQLDGPAAAATATQPQLGSPKAAAAARRNSPEPTKDTAGVHAVTAAAELAAGTPSPVKRTKSAGAAVRSASKGRGGAAAAGPRSVVAGILAEARSLSGRGPLLLRPGSVLEEAAVTGTVAALMAADEGRITQLLRETSLPHDTKSPTRAVVNIAALDNAEAIALAAVAAVATAAPLAPVAEMPAAQAAGAMHAAGTDAAATGVAPGGSVAVDGCGMMMESCDDAIMAALSALSAPECPQGGALNGGAGTGGCVAPGLMDTGDFVDLTYM